MGEVLGVSLQGMWAKSVIERCFTGVLAFLFQCFCWVGHVFPMFVDFGDKFGYVPLC